MSIAIFSDDDSNHIAEDQNRRRGPAPGCTQPTFDSSAASLEALDVEPRQRLAHEAADSDRIAQEVRDVYLTA
jgi:hypothetical protein